MKKLLLLTSLILSLSIFAQDNINDSVSVDTFKKTSPKLIKQEKELQVLFDQILQEGSKDSTRIRLNEEIKKRLAVVLKDNDSFFYPFDSLNYLGKIYSDDYNLRVYTWCVELEDFSYKFYGFIHDYVNELIYPLTVRNKPYIPSRKRQILLNNWYGALYYKAINVNPKKKEPKYILLGWNQSDLVRKNKIIDVLTIEDDGEKVRLGSKIIRGYHGRAYRMILSYCFELGISLNYFEDEKRFVFDHLTPLSDGQDNARGCNGPDMSYDALVQSRWWKWWKSGWSIEKDVDMRNR